MTTFVIIVIGLSLIFDFLNGVHDSSNVVATMISSRAFSPRMALGVTAVANFLGPFIFGVAKFQSQIEGFSIGIAFGHDQAKFAFSRPTVFSLSDSG